MLKYIIHRAGDELDLYDVLPHHLRQGRLGQTSPLLGAAVRRQGGRQVFQRRSLVLKPVLRGNSDPEIRPWQIVPVAYSAGMIGLIRSGNSDVGPDDGSAERGDEGCNWDRAL